MLKIAIPNKGTLSEDAIRLVSESGYSCKKHSSELAIIDFANQIEFYFLRPRDIAVYVGSGFLDLGITGRDLTFDSGTTVHEVMPLNFGHSSFYYAVPAGCDFSADKLEGKDRHPTHSRTIFKKRTECFHNKLMRQRSPLNRRCRCYRRWYNPRT